MPDRAAIEATVVAYFETINAERYEETAALFADGGRLRAPGTDWVHGGGIAAYLAKALKPFPQHTDTPTRTVIAPDDAVATVEIRFTGALHSGADFAFDAIDVFDLAADGRIAQLTSWYDSHEVREQLRRVAATSAQRLMGGGWKPPAGGALSPGR